MEKEKEERCGRGDILARNTMLLSAFEKVSARAASAGIEHMILKGGALVLSGISRISRRELTDIDVLVGSDRLRDFEAVLKEQGFVLMPNSSQAWVKTSAGAAPPVIIDLHEDLRHVNNMDAFWRRSEKIFPDRPFVLRPSPADMFIHAAAHGVLHHAAMEGKAIEDMENILRAWSSPLFFKELNRLCHEYGVSGMISAVVGMFSERLCREEMRGLAPDIELGWLDGIKRRMVKRSLKSGAAVFEYALPVLFRPGLFLKYMFPSREYMQRRYGNRTWGAYILRPLRLLAGALGFRSGPSL